MGIVGDVFGADALVVVCPKFIEIYLAERNLDPKPYRWRAKKGDILAKIQRAREAMTRQAGAAV